MTSDGRLDMDLEANSCFHTLDLLHPLDYLTPVEPCHTLALKLVLESLIWTYTLVLNCGISAVQLEAVLCVCVTWNKKCFKTTALLEIGRAHV